MDYEQDYVMRMIKDMVRALALLIFGKRDIRYEIPEENARTEEDDLYTRILQMADRGEINEAGEYPAYRTSKRIIKLCCYGSRFLSAYCRIQR